MDPLFAKHYNVLLGRFTTLLNSYSPADPGKALEPLDAFFAYRLFLGRNPEPTEELPNLLSRKGTLREFLCAIQASPEFARTGGFFRHRSCSCRRWRASDSGSIQATAKWEC